MIKFKTRKIKRDLWVVLYRHYRIVRRESTKAAIDTMLYGSGFVRYAGTTIQHVPWAEARR